MNNVEQLLAAFILAQNMESQSPVVVVVAARAFPPWKARIRRELGQNDRPECEGEWVEIRLLAQAGQANNRLLCLAVCPLGWLTKPVKSFKINTQLQADEEGGVCLLLIEFRLFSPAVSSRLAENRRPLGWALKGRRCS